MIEKLMRRKHTSLGAIMDDSVILFSVGNFVFAFPIMTRLSPEGTALTLPLNHPVVVALGANFKICKMHSKNKQLKAEK